MKDKLISLILIIYEAWYYLLIARKRLRELLRGHFRPICSWLILLRGGVLYRELYRFARNESIYAIFIDELNLGMQFRDRGLEFFHKRPGVDYHFDFWIPVRKVPWKTARSLLLSHRLELLTSPDGRTRHVAHIVERYRAATFFQKLRW